MWKAAWTCTVNEDSSCEIALQNLFDSDSLILVQHKASDQRVAEQLIASAESPFSIHQRICTSSEWLLLTSAPLSSRNVIGFSGNTISYLIIF